MLFIWEKKYFETISNEPLTTFLEQNFAPFLTPVLFLSSSQGTLQPEALRIELDIVIISQPRLYPYTSNIESVLADGTVSISCYRLAWKPCRVFERHMVDPAQMDTLH